MRGIVCALCVLWSCPVLSALPAACPRREPPPGVVLVSLGSELVLSCTGHVSVDGAKVWSSSLQGSSAAVTHSTVNSISHNTVLQKQHVSMHQRNRGHAFPPNSSSSLSPPSRAKSDWDMGAHLESVDRLDGEDRGDKAAKFYIQWKFNSKDMEGDAEGPTLSLSRVRMSDSGRYSCHCEGTERFSTRVVVSEAPETPRLSCYKRSPSSKIRCEWTPQRPVPKGSSGSLLVRRGLTGGFLKVPCSYSARRSRWWCALDFDEEDKRKLHLAVLCVSSFSSNATSKVLFFKPFDILKPDPPYNVSVRPQTGLSRALMITWKPPNTWKLKDLDFYALQYQIRYKPLLSKHYQRINVSVTRHTVRDAEAGWDYEVQVRTKDEYEGLWSEWSAPQYGRSWTEVSKEDLFTTPFPYWYSEGSGAEDSPEETMAATPVFSHHYLWMMIVVFVGLSLTVFVVYVIRYKGKCVSKVHSLGALAQCSGLLHPRPPPAPAAATEGHALLNKDRPQNEVKDRSEQEPRNKDTTEATDFNNTSYFYLHKGKERSV